MKVLLIYPELPFSFWSFKLACRVQGVKALFPPLGILTVAALLPSDWQSRLVDMNVQPIGESDWKWADLVMLSAMLLQRDTALKVIAEARQRGKTVVVGGTYPTLEPEEVLSAGGDYVVKGEAEATIPALLNALQTKATPRIIEHAEKPDLTVSPIPRFDLVCVRDYANMAIQTTRGCPFACEFCDIAALFGRPPRHKKADQVVRELEALYRTGYRGTVFVCDDNFVGNRDHALNVLAAMTEWNRSHGEPFGYITQASVNLGQDRELVDRMTAANFGEVFIGLETPDQQALRSAGKTQNLRSPMVESVNTIKENGLTVVESFIIGFDDEQAGVAQRICDVVDQTDAPTVMVNLLKAAPQTALWRRLKQEGRLLEDRKGVDTVMSKLNFRSRRPEGEILQDYVHLWRHLYEPSRYLDRVYRYYRAMRPTRRAQAQARGERPPPEPNARRRSLRENSQDLRAVLFLAWRQGIAGSCRVQFWRQFIGIQRSNPSRLRAYLSRLMIGENLFEVRDLIVSTMETGTLENESGTGASGRPGREPPGPSQGRQREPR